MKTPPDFLDQQLGAQIFEEALAAPPESELLQDLQALIDKHLIPRAEARDQTDCLLLNKLKRLVEQMRRLDANLALLNADWSHRPWSPVCFEQETDILGDAGKTSLLEAGSAKLVWA